MAAFFIFRAVTCRKSFVLLLSDGAWNGAVDPIIPAHKLRTEDLRTLQGNQQGAVYVIHAFGDNDSEVKSQGRNALISTAIFGGFKDRNSDGWPYPFSEYTAEGSATCDTLGNTARSALVAGNQTYCNSRGVTYPLDVCSPSSWNSLCSEWGRKADGLPYNFFEAEEGSQLERVIEQAFKTILTGLSSGTSASFVNSSAGSGAALVQALFYPNRRFEAEETAWTGELQNLWYYIDPFLEKSSIREETGYTSGDHVLDLTQDYVLTYEFDRDNARTKVTRSSDSTGKGTPLVAIGTATPDTVGTNWRAGQALRLTDPADRNIFTTINGSTLVDFKATNAAALTPYLSASNPAEIISYIRGDDTPEDSASGKYRSRGATIGGETLSWKLGDIISSLPKAQSAFPLNIYQVPPPNGYGDQTYGDFVRSNTYKNRKSIYVGANDGMLHAFNLGVMSHVSKGPEKAKLTGSDLGKEA